MAGQARLNLERAMQGLLERDLEKSRPLVQAMEEIKVELADRRKVLLANI